MDPSRSRGKRILQLAMQKNKESFEIKDFLSFLNAQQTEPNLMKNTVSHSKPSNSMCPNPPPVEDSDDENGDFPPASDDDRTYQPESNRKRRRSTSSSSSSSCSSSSSSSSYSSSSSSCSSSSNSSCSASNKSLRSSYPVEKENMTPNIITIDRPSFSNDKNRSLDDSPAEDYQNQTNEIYFKNTTLSMTDLDVSPSLLTEYNCVEADDSNAPATSTSKKADSTLIVIPSSLAVDQINSKSINNSVHTETTEPALIITPNSIPFDQNPQTTDVISKALEIENQSDTVLITKKRKKSNRKSSVAKQLRDSGKQYVSTSQSRKVFPARVLKPSCGFHCKLKCPERVSETSRLTLFESYWNMASIERQREYIARNLDNVCPKYQYKKLNSNRKPKNAFHFEVNGQRIRVCKIFFKNTLGITDRCIRTVLQKKSEITGVLEGEKRGKHLKHKKILF